MLHQEKESLLSSTSWLGLRNTCSRQLMSGSWHFLPIHGSRGGGGPRVRDLPPLICPPPTSCGRDDTGPIVWIWLLFRTNGPSDQRAFGLTDPSDQRAFGLSDQRDFGLSDLRTIGPSDYWTLHLQNFQKTFNINYKMFKNQRLDDRHCRSRWSSSLWANELSYLYLLYNVCKFNFCYVWGLKVFLIHLILWYILKTSKSRFLISK